MGVIVRRYPAVVMQTGNGQRRGDGETIRHILWLFSFSLKIVGQFSSQNRAMCCSTEATRETLDRPLSGIDGRVDRSAFDLSVCLGAEE